jgi:periplasmic divalent cation tolerance protein
VGRETDEQRPGMGILLAFSTCPDQATADRIAGTLVSEGLAACVNRLPGVRSTYFWDGRLQDDAEILLIIKTTDRRLPDLVERLTALHPYEVPELVAVPVVGGNEPYLDWVRMGVGNKGACRE